MLLATHKNIIKDTKQYTIIKQNTFLYFNKLTLTISFDFFILTFDKAISNKNVIQCAISKEIVAVLKVCPILIGSLREWTFVIKEQIEIKKVNLSLKEYLDVEYIFDEDLYKKENGYIQIPISNILYKLNEEKTLYVAEPFDIFFKVKSNKEGTIIINEESYISYEDI